MYAQIESVKLCYWCEAVFKSLVHGRTIMDMFTQLVGLMFINEASIIGSKHRLACRDWVSKIWLSRCWMWLSVWALCRYQDYFINSWMFKILYLGPFNNNKGEWKMSILYLSAVIWFQNKVFLFLMMGKWSSQYYYKPYSGKWWLKCELMKRSMNICDKTFLIDQC